VKAEEKYTRFALVREMMETPDILRNFKLEGVDDCIGAIKDAGRLFFTGEGSSRIFPAKNAMTCALRAGTAWQLATEGARQAAEYDLSGFAVFGASNSGKTREVVELFDRLRNQGHKKLFGLTANTGTRLEALCDRTFILSCGKEEAVAATKSVAEQALFYQSLLARFDGGCLCPQKGPLGDAFEAALTMDLPEEIVEAVAGASTIFFAGRNDGVAEELTLKTNEITRKKSDYLEGTYAVHGIEEVMEPGDVVVVMDPFAVELEKFKEVLVDGVGLKVFAVAAEDTVFPTVKVPDAGELSAFVYLAAGWNILVEAGLRLGIDLDKPERARKVGNEFVEEPGRG